MKNIMIEIINEIIECKSLLSVAKSSVYSNVEHEDLIITLEITERKLNEILNEFNVIV